VSAVSASPAVVGSSPADPVRALQHALYRAAKVDPGRRFHALRDKVFRRDVLWRAWVTVYRNGGASGIDRITLADVEEYGATRLLNELAAELRNGSYRPLPARRVLIPKPGTVEKRPLSIPTIADRVAQTVARMYLEPKVEPIFHPDSYGYRPKKSALDAVGVCRRRCWKADWVIDLDIKAFFDSVPWDLILKVVEHHTDQRWILLYVRRWLAAPLQRQDGTMVERDRGTPQGSAISPLLANMFMHYAFDAWMVREFPNIPFERYCDDAVVHCGSERQARQVRDAIAARLARVGLELHPDKTRIVYCQDADRRDDHEVTSFTFLGYTFRPRLAKNKWGSIS
jgi:RNA-directed DNA polymerase